MSRGWQLLWYYTGPFMFSWFWFIKTKESFGLFLFYQSFSSVIEPPLTTQTHFNLCHPDCCEGRPRQCIHQAATTTPLTFESCILQLPNWVILLGAMPPPGLFLEASGVSGRQVSDWWRLCTKGKKDIPCTFPWVLGYFMFLLWPVSSGQFLVSLVFC